MTSGTGATLRCTPVADHAVLVHLAVVDHERDDDTEATANRAVVALDRAIVAADLPGVREVVPALVNLLVDFDPTLTDHVAIEQAVNELWRSAEHAAPAPVVHRVEVCYESPLASDIEAVADACGLSVDGVIAAHLAGDYRVLMYGFAPGCAYLGGVPNEIRVPRKPAPVRGVRAGSVIIAGPQCLITTLTMPTGWSIVGASPAQILPTEPDAPFLFGHGDAVRFERIDLATFEAAGGPA